MKASSLKLLMALLVFSQFMSVLSIDGNTTIDELDDDEIELVDPPVEGGRPLFEVFNDRKTGRDFENKKDVTLRQLSQLLWSGYGPNRDDKHKTVPSAVAMYPLIFYVFMETGIYSYVPDENILELVLSGDYRDLTGTQAFAKKAAIDIVILVDYKTKSSNDMEKDQRKNLALLDVGHCSQNMYLYCANEGLNCVVRGSFDNDKLIEVLDVDKKRYEVVTTFSAGY